LAGEVSAVLGPATPSPGGKETFSRYASISPEEEDEEEEEEEEEEEKVATQHRNRLARGRSARTRRVLFIAHMSVYGNNH